MRPTPEERFVSKMHAGLGCWFWTDALSKTGYGEFYADGRRQLAHRWSYEFFIGPIPDGLHIDHLCRNRSCVNPFHMEPVTNRVNVLRGIGITALNARKTHCKWGHEFTPDNTYNPPTGGRKCRRCIANSMAKYEANNKERRREQWRTYNEKRRAA